MRPPAVAFTAELRPRRPVRRPLAVALTWLCIALAVTLPAPARAEVTPIATVATFTPLDNAGAAQRIGPATLAILREGVSDRAHAAFARTPTEIRLSSGAKTAIIIGAVVVGVLIIVGVVAISGPGKRL